MRRQRGQRLKQKLLPLKKSAIQTQTPQQTKQTKRQQLLNQNRPPLHPPPRPPPTPNACRPGRSAKMRPKPCATPCGRKSWPGTATKCAAKTCPGAGWFTWANSPAKSCSTASLAAGAKHRHRPRWWQPGARPVAGPLLFGRGRHARTHPPAAQRRARGPGGAGACCGPGLHPAPARSHRGPAGPAGGLGPGVGGQGVAAL